MKKVFLCLALSVCAIVSTFGQNVERGFSFQGIARDINGKAIGSSIVDIQLSITQAGVSVYVEQQPTVTTDAFGVFTAVIGSMVPGNFAKIDFSKDSKLKVEVKVGGSYSLLSETDLLSVPYAKYADKANYASTASSATISSTADYAKTAGTADYAKTAFFPAGMIMAFAGNQAPAGWLFCNGIELSKNDYPDLFNAIGFMWGGDGASKFNIPDLRGRFLRGADWGAGNDPNATSRTPIKSGAGSGANAVGTFQSYTTRVHLHFGDGTEDNNRIGAWGGSGNGFSLMSTKYANYLGITPESGGADQGGSETRPSNVAVFYIIKL